MAEIKFRNERQFNLELKKFKQLPAEAHKALLKKIGFELLSRIVQKTPVDTGRARGNWQVVVDTNAPGNALDNADTNGNATISAGVSELAGVKPFGTVVIYNNVNYIVFLEEGSSRQARQGMVAISIAEVDSINR